MKKSIIVGILLILFSTYKTNSQTTITLLHVNDTHSHLDAFGTKDVNLEGTIGGIAKAASVIGSVRASEPNVLLLHAGDAFVGDPMFNTYFGIPEFQIMKQLGFDAMTVGNHELDFGPGVLYNSLNTAFTGGSFPLLSANLDMTEFPALKTWVQPSIIKTIAGVKIGIFGMTVPNIATTNASPLIISDDIVNIARQTASSLRDSGADVVICLSHLGIFYDQLVVENTSGIDFIIGGHDHYLFKEAMSFNNLDGVPIPVFQAGKNYKYIGKMHFTFNKGEVTINDYQIINVDESVPFYQPIQNIIESLKPGIVAQFGDLYNTVIGTSKATLNYRFDTTSSIRDTPLGNLITDAFRDKTQTDFAVDPIGLIRDDIYTGPIVGADAFRSKSIVGEYEPLPAPHFVGLKLVTFNITGAELVHGIEYTLSQLKFSDDYFLQVSGLKYKYNLTKPEGHRVIVKSIKMDQKKKFSLSATYSVTVNAGAARVLGLAGIVVTNLEISPDFEWKVVSDYISKIENVNYLSEGRIVEIKEEDDDDKREISLLKENKELSNIFKNYPNPFDQSTTITFTLAHSQKMSVKIFDVNGRLVSTLADKIFQNGENKLEWNVGKINKGVYFLHFQSPGNLFTKKLIVTK